MRTQGLVAPLFWVPAAAIAAGSLAPPAFACLWYHGTDLAGRQVTLESAPPEVLISRLTAQVPSAEWEKKLASLETASVAAQSPQAISDHAAILIRLGRLDEAIEILEGLEASSPGLYYVAANLGTALELKGDLAGALRWIEEGLRRDPGSHEGTEWLHVEILRARIELGKDPTRLWKRGVLGLSFGVEPAPVLPERLAGDPKELARVQSALEYQLHERISFVPPKDPVVADLLFDLANIYAYTKSVEFAGAVLSLAIRYGEPLHGLWAPRLEHFRKLAAASELKRLAWSTTKYGGAAVLALILCLLAVKGLRRAGRPGRGDA